MKNKPAPEQQSTTEETDTQAYFVPEFGIAVEATTPAEAVKKARELAKKQEDGDAE